MLNELLFRRAPWTDRLSRVAQTAGDLLHEHGIYCLVGAFRVDDGRSSRLLIELRGDLPDTSPEFSSSLKALLVHGLNRQLNLGLKAQTVVLALSGEDVRQLPSLKAASVNVLQRAKGVAADLPRSLAAAVAADLQDTIEMSGHSTQFAATVAVPRGADSHFGAL